MTLLAGVFIIFISKFLGFFRDVALAFCYGSGELSQLFIVSFLIVYTLPQTLMNAFHIVFSKYYHNSMKRSEREKFISVVFTSVVILSIIILSICLYFSSSIMMIFHIKMTFYVDMFMCALPAILISSLLLSIIRNEGYFVFYTLLSSLYVFLVFFIFAGYILGLYLLPISFLSIFYLQLFLAFLFVRFFLKIRIKFYITIKRSGLVFINSVIITLLIYSSDTINLFFDRLLASHLSARSVVNVVYGSNLTMTLLSVYSIVLSSYFFPRVNKLDLMERASYINKLVKVVGCVGILASITMYLFSQTIVDILYLHGSFSFSDAKETVLMIKGLSFSVVFIMVFYTFAMYFYSKGKNKRILIVTSFTCLVKVCLSYIFLYNLGILALGLGTTIASSLGLFILMFMYYREYSYDKRV